MLPLIEAGSTHLPPSLFANWEQYGIILEKTNSEVSGPLLVPCLRYKVRPRDPTTATPNGPHTQLLHLFIMLEAERGVGNTTVISKWQDSINLTSALRRNWMLLTSTHCKAFFKAAHSALNKLLCNYAQVCVCVCVCEFVVSAGEELYGEGSTTCCRSSQ